MTTLEQALAAERRNSPAQPNRWNAWRYPTPAEIAKGRAEYDMYWVGADISKDVAAALLRGVSGQLQFGLDGEPVNVDKHGSY